MLGNTCKTPCIIEVLIHYNMCSDPHPRLQYPAIQDAIEYLLKHELIRSSRTSEDISFVTTKKGQLHIKQLCNVPFPVEKTKWIGYDGKELDYCKEK